VRRALALLAALAVAACGDARRGERKADTTLATPGAPAVTPEVPAPTAVAPAVAGRTDSAAATAPPVASVILRADSAAGDVIFHGQGRCFTCHGNDGRGVPRIGPSLADSTWLHGDGSLAFIASTVRDGIAAPREASAPMPAYAGVLKPEQIDRVAAYVYTLSHPGRTVTDTTRAAPDTTAHAP
jgi:mono/diheme cytochrome c family protein